MPSMPGKPAKGLGPPNGLEFGLTPGGGVEVGSNPSIIWRSWSSLMDCCDLGTVEALEELLALNRVAFVLRGS